MGQKWEVGPRNRPYLLVSITRLLGYLFQVLEITQIFCVNLGQVVSQGEGSIREHPELLTLSFALFNTNSSSRILYCPTSLPPELASTSHLQLEG